MVKKVKKIKKNKNENSNLINPISDPLLNNDENINKKRKRTTMKSSNNNEHHNDNNNNNLKIKKNKNKSRKLNNNINEINLNLNNNNNNINNNIGNILSINKTTDHITHGEDTNDNFSSNIIEDNIRIDERINHNNDPNIICDHICDGLQNIIFYHPREIRTLIETIFNIKTFQTKHKRKKGNTIWLYCTSTKDKKECSFYIKIKHGKDNRVLLDRYNIHHTCQHQDLIDFNAAYERYVNIDKVNLIKEIELNRNMSNLINNWKNTPRDISNNIINENRKFMNDINIKHQLMEKMVFDKSITALEEFKSHTSRSFDISLFNQGGKKCTRFIHCGHKQRLPWSHTRMKEIIDGNEINNFCHYWSKLIKINDNNNNNNDKKYEVVQQHLIHTCHYNLPRKELSLHKLTDNNDIDALINADIPLITKKINNLIFSCPEDIQTLYEIIFPDFPVELKTHHNKEITLICQNKKEMPMRNNEINNIKKIKGDFHEYCPFHIKLSKVLDGYFRKYYVVSINLIHTCQNNENNL